MGAFSFDVCGRRAAAARRVDGLGQAAAGPQQDPETRHFRRFAIGLAMRQTWPGRSRQSAAAKRRRPTSFSAVRVQSALCPQCPRFQQLLPPFRVPLRAARLSCRRLPGQATGPALWLQDTRMDRLAVGAPARRRGPRTPGPLVARLGRGVRPRQPPHRLKDHGARPAT